MSSADNDERAGLAMDLLLTSFHGRPLPTIGVQAEVAVEGAFAVADAFLETAAPTTDPHALLEIAVAFKPLVDIGNTTVPVLLAEDPDEAFRFQGPRAAILGLAEREFDNPEEALDALREVEARERRNVEMGERLVRASNPPMAQLPPSPPEATPPADDSDDLVF